MAKHWWGQDGKYKGEILDEDEHRKRSSEGGGEGCLSIILIYFVLVVGLEYLGYESMYYNESDEVHFTFIGKFLLILVIIISFLYFFSYPIQEFLNKQKTKEKTAKTDNRKKIFNRIETITLNKIDSEVIKAAEIVILNQKGKVKRYITLPWSLIKIELKIDTEKADKIIEQLETLEIIGPHLVGLLQREVLIPDLESLEKHLDNLMEKDKK